jgi:uncharacterized iron-regulated membrane protein
LAFGFAAFFSAAGFFAAVFFGVLAFLGLAASFFLGLTTSPILNDPEAPKAHNQPKKAHYLFIVRSTQNL